MWVAASVDAAVGGGHEDRLGGQRVHDLDVLDAHEAEAVEAVAFPGGAVPADADLVGVGLVDLLVAVAQPIGRLAAGRGVVGGIRGAALLDGDVGGGRPRGGERLLNRLGVRRPEGTV